MYSHTRLLACIFTLLVFSQPSPASESSRPDGIRAFLQQGEYNLAIKAAHTILSQPDVTEHERYELLHVLAEAEEKFAEMGHYARIEIALRAYEDLNKEFPEKFGPDKLQWKIALLNWKHGDFNRADTAAQVILQDHAKSPEAKKAALMHARHLITEKRFQAARSVLLIHFGLNPNINAKEETQGLVWLAVIDEAESRTKQAYKLMQRAYGKHPTVIQSNAMIYASYIRLLDLYSEREELLTHIDLFIKKHIASPEAPEIRLLQANALTAQGKTQDAEIVYGILADHHANFAIGKKALMRKMMLKIKNTQDEKALSQALTTLSNLASTHQLTDIEAEAQLYQAQLLVRLSHTDSKYIDRAIYLYALVVASENPAFVDTALEDGSILLGERLHTLLEQRDWLQAVLLWKRYPQLRPAKADKLSFRIAQAYIQLMDYSHAEQILDGLYEQAKDTVWGQRIMLELARLWTERKDTDSVTKIMRWLTSQEHTLYRQDMLLIVATAQNEQGKASAARQTLTGVVPEDLTPVLRRTYWHTRAKINQSLQRWHIAAESWRRLAELSQGGEKWTYVYAQADATIQSKDYLNAENILLLIPETEQTAAWHYSLALCARNTGRWKKAEEHLIPLSKGDAADNYTMRARLMLADKSSEQLIREQQ